MVIHKDSVTHRRWNYGWDRHESNTKFSNIPKNVLEDYLKEGKTLRKAAKLANIPYPTFRKACIYNHIEYNSSTSAQHT